jgi:hypothetical protein
MTRRTGRHLAPRLGTQSHVFGIRAGLSRWLAILGLVLFPAVAEAQEFAYGAPEDLAGTLWMFVYTGSQMSERADIMKKLQKELPHLRYANDPRQADIVLVYGSAKSNVFAGNWNQAIGAGTTTCSSMGATATCYSSGQASGYSVPMYAPVRTGRGLVLVRSANGELRLVLEHSDESRMLEKSPHSKFTGRFIKEYRKQNPTPPTDRPARDVPSDTYIAAAGQTASQASQGPPAGSQTLVFAGSYTASVSPNTNFEGRMDLRVHGDAVAGSLKTNSGRQAAVAGVASGGQLNLTFRFSDGCEGTAKAAATLDASALVGNYTAIDCLGEYTGTFALLLMTQ